MMGSSPDKTKTFLTVQYTLVILAHFGGDFKQFLIRPYDSIQHPTIRQVHALSPCPQHKTGLKNGEAIGCQNKCFLHIV